MHRGALNRRACYLQTNRIAPADESARQQRDLDGRIGRLVRAPPGSQNAVQWSEEWLTGGGALAGRIKRIKHALLLYPVVARHIAHMRRMGSTCLDLDAKLFFDTDEIQAAYLLNKS
jgi:hypothetical protein